MKRFGSIYMITNVKTGKQYVGQTTSSVQSRFNNHCRDKRSSRYLSSAIQKHGSVNFIVEELMACFDAESMNDGERKHVKGYTFYYANQSGSVALIS